MRIKYGKKIIWQEKDAWSMDDTLNPIIGSGIQFFKDTIVRKKEEGQGFIGVPNNILIPDAKEDFKSTDEGWELAWVEWLSVLDDMVYAFLAKDIEIPDDAFKMNFSKGEIGDTYIPMTITHPNQEAYDSYKDLCAVHDARKLKGLAYFKEHYHSLWW